MRTLPGVVPLCLLAAACLPGAGSRALCTASVQVDGVVYDSHGPAANPRPGSEYARTSRRRGCPDVFVRAEPAPWADGDSNFLAPNTPLYTSLDHPPGEVLLVRRAGRWEELRRSAATKNWLSRPSGHVRSERTAGN